MKTRFRIIYLIAILGLLLQGISYAENHPVTEPPDDYECKCTWIGQHCMASGWGRLCVWEGFTGPCRAFDRNCERGYNLERD